MTVRSRERTDVFTGSRTEKFGGHVTNTRSYISNFEHCDDETGPGDNGPFTVNRITRDGGLINGIEKSNLSGYIWNDYPCAYITDAFLTSHLSISGQPTDGTLAAQTAARTQPFRHEIISWEYISELSELGGRAQKEFLGRLAKLSKFISRSEFKLLKKGAKITLLTRFGLIPLVSDIKTLATFQKRVDKRVAEMERLYGKRGLRRTLDLWNGSSTANVSSQTIQSQGVLLHAAIRKTTTVEVKAHIRWYGYYPVQKTDSQLRRMAETAVIGNEIDPYTLYELMPWSWLVDYFTNLGDIVKAGKNLFQVHHESVRIMEHRRTISHSSNHDVNNQGVGFVITCTPMNVTSETKTRRLASPSILASDAILTGSQLSILGSLAVLRFL